MFCPYYRNKEVFNGFNEIIEALGGKPMTEEEFRSSELRNKRTGLDYSAMEAAYKVYHRNNGNLMDKAPNGNDSVLFKTLLEHFGNRTDAIVAKTNVYSDEFFNWFGDWTGSDYKSDAAEKLISKLNNIVNSDSKYSALAQLILDNRALPYNLKYFKIDNNRDDIEGHSAMWHSLANLIEVLGNNVPEEEINKALLHELIHYNTEELLAAYKNSPENVPQNIRQNIKELYSIINYAKKYITEHFDEKKYREIAERQNKNVGSRVFYAFDNQGSVEIDEFVSEIFTNPGLQEILNEIPYKKSKQTLWDKIKNCIQLIFGFDINSGSVLDESLKASAEFVTNTKQVSKVVDENGEPFVVYHNTRAQFDKFDKKYIRVADGFFFTVDNTPMKAFGDRQVPVYLNVKNLKETYSTFPTGDDFNYQNDGFDGMQYFFMNSESFIIPNSNQIKHIENLGTWNPDDPNIYHVSAEPKTQQYRTQSVVLDEFFDFEDLNKLLSGEAVESSKIIQHLLNNEVFAQYNQYLADVAVKHNFPIVFNKLPIGRPMDTKEYEDGSIVIEIDQEQLQYYSQEDAAEYVLHEVVHALSVKALRKPETQEELDFSTTTKKVYDIFDKLMPESEWSRSSMDTGAYILSDIYEFAAVFATDKNAKMLLYQKAVEEDKKGNNKVFLRLKRFINALSRLLVNKNVFKGIKQDELALYEKNINKFLVNRKSDEQLNNDIIEAFKQNLDALTPVSVDNSRIALLRERLMRREANYIRHFVASEPSDARAHTNLWQTRIKVSEALETRLAAINSSTIDNDVKYKAKSVIEAQLEQFKNSNISTVVVLSSFIQQTLPQLLDDVDAVRNMDESSHSFYMYNMHDNFGAYAAIFNQLDKDLKDRRYIDELKQEFEGITSIDKLSVTKDVDDMLSIISDAAATARDGVNYMYNILMNNMRRDLQKLGEEVNFSSTKEMLDSLSTIGFDTNTFINILGSKDGAQDPVIRSIVYLTNKAVRKSKEETVNVATKLLQLNDALRSGESALDLYELDRDGFTTQYLVRELNFGNFYKDFRDFIESLNDKYELPKGNRKSPEDPKKRKQWNIDKNKWLSQHAERRFMPEYYEAYAELSDDTLQQLNSIRGAISQLKEKAYDKDDKYYHYDRLSPEEWRRLQGLYIEKRLLGSDYTLYGDLKIEGTDAYRWAKEIQALNEKLYTDKNQINRATDAWAKARNEFIQASIEKHTKDGETNMAAVNSDVWKWDERNSKRVFKKDGDKLAVFKLIEEQVEKLVGFSRPIYDYNGDNGALYEANRQRINETIDIFRDYNTGEPNLDIMPARVRSNIQKLEVENKKIKSQALKNNTELAKKAKKWGKVYTKVFNTYLQSVYTSYYRKRMIDEDIDLENIKKPRWATRLVVRNKIAEDGESLIDKFTELIPGDGWINSDENNSLINPNFDTSMNVPYIPVKSLYDNSIHYNRIMSSPTLRALYEASLEAMQNANAKLYNRLYQDDYMLPGITGSMWKYMKGHGMSGSVAQVLRYTKDHLGFTEQGIRQDTEFGSTLKDALATVTELGEYVAAESSFGSKATGVRPDGRQFNIIPQYYTKKLDDTSQLSSDLIGMICEYYESACNFENKSEIKDFVESMVDVIENRRYEIENKRTGNKEVKQGNATKTFEGAKKFVEMNLYNIRSSSAQVGSLNLGKTAQNFSRLTQALNLGMSPAVALTGFFTAQYAHLINAIVGDRGYSMNEWTQATGEVIGHYIKNYGGVQYASNQLSNDKVMLLAEYFDVANQLKRKFKNANRSRIIRFFDNWCFGGLTTVDFASKSTIMVTILMAHRYMDGKFVSREDVLNRLEASSKEGEKALLEKWNQGKTLYSIFKVNNGELEIDPEYKKAFEAVKNVVYNRINKTAESADGMATETQKAAITTNFFGAAVLTHRQYLPLMIQQRFLPQVWDFDMQMYVQGQYVVDYQFFKNVLWATAKDGFKISTFKELYEKFTHDTSSEENWKLSRARSKALKKTAVELAMFNLIVVPLVGLICMFADDNDNRDKLALQLAAYIARRTQWEVFTPYRFDDMLNNIKSVSAQTGTLDKFDALKNTISRRIFPQGSLFDALLEGKNNKELSDIITRGVYEGHTRTYKTFMQLTPYHNFYEQWYGSKAKRSYYEKQIMKLED